MFNFSLLDKKELYRLIVDGNLQSEEQGWHDYAMRERGCLPAAFRGLGFALTNLTEIKLTPKLIKTIHHYVLDKVGGVRLEATSQFRKRFAGFGLKTNTNIDEKGLAALQNRYTPLGALFSIKKWSKHYSSQEELDKDMDALSETKVDNMSLELINKKTIFYRAPPYQYIESIILFICNSYNIAIVEAKTAEEKLKVIAQHIQLIDQAHPYIDGNIRTCYILLQRMLIQHHFPPCMMENPNHFDAYAIDVLVDKIKEGIANTQALVTQPDMPLFHYTTKTVQKPPKPRDYLPPEYQELYELACTEIDKYYEEENRLYEFLITLPVQENSVDIENEKDNDLKEDIIKQINRSLFTADNSWYSLEINGDKLNLLRQLLENLSVLKSHPQLNFYSHKIEVAYFQSIIDGKMTFQELVSQQGLIDLENHLLSLDSLLKLSFIQNFFSRWYDYDGEKQLQNRSELFVELSECYLNEKNDGIPSLIKLSEAVLPIVLDGLNDDFLSIYQINRLFLHAFCYTPTEWSETFYDSLLNVIQLLKNPNEAHYINKEFYPKDLLNQLDELMRIYRKEEASDSFQLTLITPELITDEFSSQLATQYLVNASSKSEKLVTSIINNIGFSLNSSDKSFSPMTIALNKKDNSIIRALINQGDDPNKLNQYSQVFLDWCLEKNDLHTAILILDLFDSPSIILNKKHLQLFTKKLNKKNLDSDDHKTLMTYAIKNEYETIIYALLHYNLTVKKDFLTRKMADKLINLAIYDRKNTLNNIELIENLIGLYSFNEKAELLAKKKIMNQPLLFEALIKPLMPDYIIDKALNNFTFFQELLEYPSSLEVILKLNEAQQNPIDIALLIDSAKITELKSKEKSNDNLIQLKNTESATLLFYSSNSNARSFDLLLTSLPEKIRWDALHKEYQHPVINSTPFYLAGKNPKNLLIMLRLVPAIKRLELLQELLAYNKSQLFDGIVYNNYPLISEILKLLPEEDRLSMLKINELTSRHKPVIHHLYDVNNTRDGLDNLSKIIQSLANDDAQKLALKIKDISGISLLHLAASYDDGKNHLFIETFALYPNDIRLESLITGTSYNNNDSAISRIINKKEIFIKVFESLKKEEQLDVLKIKNNRGIPIIYDVIKEENYLIKFLELSLLNNAKEADSLKELGNIILNSNDPKESYINWKNNLPNNPEKKHNISFFSGNIKEKNSDFFDFIIKEIEVELGVINLSVKP